VGGLEEEGSLAYTELERKSISHGMNMYTDLVKEEASHLTSHLPSVLPLFLEASKDINHVPSVPPKWTKYAYQNHLAST
jgi:hypothetical protein